MDNITTTVTINFADDVLVEIPGTEPGTSHKVYLGKLSPVLVLSLYAVAEQLENILTTQDQQIH